MHKLKHKQLLILTKGGIIQFSLGPNKVTWDEHELNEVINLRKKKNRGFLGNKPKNL